VRLPSGTDFFRPHEKGITIAPYLSGFGDRSNAFSKATQAISRWYNRPLRNEMYPVIEKWGDSPLAQIDRAGVPWFGLKAFGVHVNGFVRKPDGIHLWIGERATDREVEPGKLDNLIGGGQPIGLSIDENLVKEAKEEAGIEVELARTAKSVRKLSYKVDRPEGFRDDTLFLYDLELPESFTPVNKDGEVAKFHLMSLPEVAALVRDTDRFKFNCNLVVIDFLVRHEFLKPDHAEYIEVVRALERKPMVRK